jgi:hypothetical protein
VTGFQTDSQGSWIEKSPEGVLDYMVDWNANGWLGEDTLVSVAWLLDTGLTIVTQASTATTATIWLSGGVLGVTYWVKCTVVTAAGRTEARSFRLVVVRR